MSAFILGETHIGAMVATWLRLDKSPYWDGRRVRSDDFAALCAVLAAENARSVNYRYQTHDPQEASVVTRPWDQYADLSPVALLKACDCYEYQTCETPDWRDTPAMDLCDRIRSAAVRALPGYEDADWDVTSLRHAQAARDRQRKADRAEQDADTLAYYRAFAD